MTIIKKWRVPVVSYVIIEADSASNALKEFNSIKDSLSSRMRIPSDTERDLFLNADISGDIQEEEDWTE